MTGTRRTKPAFSIIIVVAMIALVGAAAFVLTEASKDLMFQADRAYLDACERNLAAGALAWAKLHAAEAKAPPTAKPRSLNADPLRIPGGAVSVTWVESTDTPVKVRITSRCERNDVVRNHRREYSISAR